MIILIVCLKFLGNLSRFHVKETQIIRFKLEIKMFIEEKPQFMGYIDTSTPYYHQT